MLPMISRRCPGHAAASTWSAKREDQEMTSEFSKAKVEVEWRPLAISFADDRNHEFDLDNFPSRSSGFCTNAPW